MNMNFIFMTLFLQCSLFSMGCMENLPLREDFQRQLPTLCEMTIGVIARNIKQFSKDELQKLPAELRNQIMAQCKCEKPYLFACL